MFLFVSLFPSFLNSTRLKSSWQFLLLLAIALFSDFICILYQFCSVFARDLYGNSMMIAGCTSPESTFDDSHDNPHLILKDFLKFILAVLFL